MNYRTIEEEKSVSEKIDSHIKENARIEDAWEALKWSLSHSPHVGLEMEIKGRFLYKQAKSSVTPAIRVLYTYDDNLVNIKAVDLVEDEE